MKESDSEGYCDLCDYKIAKSYGACNHIFCLDCLLHYFLVRKHKENFPPCPECNKPLLLNRHRLHHLISEYLNIIPD